MKKIVSLVLVLSLVLGASAVVFAYGNHSRGDSRYREERRRDDFRRDRESMGERLNLSEAQLEKLDDLRDKYFDQQEDLRDQLADKKEEARDMYIDQDGTESEIMSLHQEIDGLQNELSKLRVEYRLEMRKILTAEQLEEFGEFGRLGRRGFRQHRGYRMQRGFRGRRADCGSGFGPGMRY